MASLKAVVDALKAIGLQGNFYRHDWECRTERGLSVQVRKYRGCVGWGVAWSYLNWRGELQQFRVKEVVEPKETASEIQRHLKLAVSRYEFVGKDDEAVRGTLDPLKGAFRHGDPNVETEEGTGPAPGVVGHRLLPRRRSPPAG